MNNTNTSHLPELLLHLRRKINERMRDNNLKHDLTIAQMEVLLFVGQAKNQSMDAIAHHLNVKPPSATALIEKLEKQELVQRAHDDKDRRVVHIRLTQKAKKQINGLQKQKTKILDEITACLSVNDKAELERIISLMIKK
jgi:DNA-binding MarR family transcriptional regulator